MNAKVTHVMPMPPVMTLMVLLNANVMLDIPEMVLFVPVSESFC